MADSSPTSPDLTNHQGESLLVRLARSASHRFVNAFFAFPPARAVLKLRPAYYPFRVIRSRGRSNWTPDTDIRFVTSFNEHLYEVSGRRCVRTFREHNDYPIWTYIESRSAPAMATMKAELADKRARVVDLASLPLLSEFFAVARDVIPVAYGGDAPESMFPPPDRQSSGGYFRRNMFRWFRKVVAIDHARQGYSGVLIWFDSDCFSKARLPREMLSRAFGGAGVFYMKGIREMSELGLIGFDFGQPGVHELFDEMKAHYMTRQFIPQRQWDDCTTFDLVRSRRGSPVCRDIGTWGPGGHILESTMLAPYLTHDKGAHGQDGKRVPL